MIFIPSYQVEAKTLRQLQEELDKLEKAYNENKNKKSLTQSEINTLNSQINTINANIINTKKEIAASEQEIINNIKIILYLTIVLIFLVGFVKRDINKDC